MRVLKSKAVALLGAAILILAACGSNSANAVDPVGGVTAAFDIAKSGGALKQAELATCLATGGTGTFDDAFSGFFGGLGADALAQAGISQDDFLAAFKVSFDNLQTVEKSQSGDQATVHVTVKMTLSVDAGKMRDLLKRYGATQGVVPDDATIDAGVLSRLGGTLTPSETIDNDISVVQQDGKWVACGSAFAAAGGGATIAAATPPAAGNTTAPTQAIAATEAPTSGASTPAPSSAAPGLAGAPATGNAVAITAGEGFACALLSNGSVKCWGSNSYGQLGNGSTTSTNATVDVVGLTSGVAAIAARSNYACAVTNAGGVKCWGQNGNGALGNGSTTNSNVPVDVVGLTSGVKSIDTGGAHTCAIMVNGGVKCWGNNSNGELGNGSKINSSAPVDVSILTSGVTAVAAGNGFTCALTSAGGVKCWGQNSGGTLGNGSTTNSSTAVDVIGLSSGVKAITADVSYPCALTSTGGVKCWGGQSGIAVDIAGLASGVSAIGAGFGITCAIMGGGGVKCWAYAKPTLTDLPGLTSGVTAVAIGGQNTLCALTNGGGVMCASGTSSWVNVDGLTATSPGEQTPGPTTAAVGNTTAVAIGLLHTCTLTSGGGVKCWGYNGDGELGNGSIAQSATPVDVVGLTSGVGAIAAGSQHTCALTSSGGVKCWGANREGELGTGSQANSLIPVDVSGLSSGVAAIAASFGHTCVLGSGGGVKCWGFNQFGVLGNGSTTDSSTPVGVTGLTGGVSAIAAGSNDTCVLTTGGGVKCWGYNVAGQLGNGARTNSLTPVDVSGLTSGVNAITAGYDHACALTSGGGVKCWGNNPSGQLGNGSTTYSNVPVDVTSLTGGVRAVAAGDGFTCALTNGGGVKCWGSNLGNGTSVASNVPVDVAGLSSGIKAITAGKDSICAITSSGGLKCWGKSYGTTPVDVAGL